MNLFGVVTGTDPARGPGWYRVQPSINEPFMSGVSIKGTELSVGQIVAIVQHGGWDDSRRAFAFAETNCDIWSSVELGRSRDNLIDQAKVGAFLAWLSHKAGRAEELYHPARVTAVGASTLTVADWYTGAALGSLPVAADLSASSFSVGDGVLLRMTPAALKRVEGWWETVPNSESIGVYWIHDSTISGNPIVFNRIIFGKMIWGKEFDSSEVSNNWKQSWPIPDENWVENTDIRDLDDDRAFPSNGKIAAKLMVDGRNPWSFDDSKMWLQFFGHNAFIYYAKEEVFQIFRRIYSFFEITQNGFLDNYELKKIVEPGGKIYKGDDYQTLGGFSANALLFPPNSSKPGKFYREEEYQLYEGIFYERTLVSL